jgi:hypothetical protein
MTFSTLRKRLVSYTEKKLANGRRVTPKHRTRAKRIVDTSIVRVVTDAIDLHSDFDFVDGDR